MTAISRPPTSYRVTVGRTRRHHVGSASRQVVIVIISAIFVIPLLWMINTSLKTSAQVFTYPPILVPPKPQWSNFIQALTTFHFGRYLINTAVISLLNVVGNLVSASLSAYGLSMVQWRHRERVFLLVLSTLLLPDAVTLIPLYTMFRSLGMVGGPIGTLPLIIPSFFGKAYFIFVLRQFMSTIPMPLADAARIDGCTEMGVLVRIVLPLCRPALVAIALFSIIGTWNDFLAPLVYLRDQPYYTVSVGLAQFQSHFQTQWPQLMAASSIAIIPIIIVFVLAQRYFFRGLSTIGGGLR